MSLLLAFQLLTVKDNFVQGEEIFQTILDKHDSVKETGEKAKNQ